MMMVRYKEYVKKMIEENPKLFGEFRTLHDKYSNEQEKYQEEYNLIGEKIQEVIKEYENRVCANTERGMYSHYSGNLAEKFQNEIRAVFPMIDFIGIKTTKRNSDYIKEEKFTIKKILWYFYCKYLNFIAASISYTIHICTYDKNIKNILQILFWKKILGDPFYYFRCRVSHHWQLVSIFFQAICRCYPLF